MTPFFNQFALSHASDNTTSRNIGGTDAGTVPHLKFGGDHLPQSHLSLRPCYNVMGARRDCYAVKFDFCIL